MESWFNIVVYGEKTTFILNFNIENYWFGQIQFWFDGAMHNDLEYNWLAYYVVLTSMAEELHATENVVCWHSARYRKCTRRPLRKAPSLRPDPNTSGTAASG